MMVSISPEAVLGLRSARNRGDALRASRQDARAQTRRRNRPAYCHHVHPPRCLSNNRRYALMEKQVRPQMVGGDARQLAAKQCRHAHLPWVSTQMESVRVDSQVDFAGTSRRKPWTHSKPPLR
jgi:hypothetical protein